MKPINAVLYRPISFIFIQCLLLIISFSMPSAASEGLTGKPVLKDPQRDTFFSLELELERLNDLIAGDSRNADYLYNRGWIFERMNDDVKAEKDYSAAIEIDKGYADALYNRGLIYLRSRRYYQAIRDFSEVIKFKPDSADAFCNRGNAYLAVGEPQNALKDFTSAIKISPQDPDLYYNRALIYLSQGKKAKAIKDMREAARLGNSQAREYLKTSGNIL